MTSMCKEVDDCCTKSSCMRFPEDFTREVLCCQICCGQFVQPRQLPCLHTFCENCLARHLQVYQMQSTSQAGQLPCPTCREMIDVPPNGICGFRHDFKVTKFADILKELDTDHGWTKACQVCRLSDQTIPAEVFCNVCNKYFCTPCLAIHDKVKLFQEHEIVDLKEREKSKILCKEHSDQIEMIKYFCDVCEIGVCTICTMTKHENHKVVDVDEGLAKQREKMKVLLAEIRCQMTDIDNTLEAIENDQGTTINTFEQLRNEISAHARRRINDIQEEERKLLMELELRERNHSENLDVDQDALTAYRKKLANYADEAKFILEEDLNATMSTKMACLDELTSAVGATISEPKPVDAMVKHVLRFTPGMMILGSLEECIGPRHELSSKFWRMVGGRGNGMGDFLTEEEYKSMEKSYSSLPMRGSDPLNSLSITTILPARGSAMMYRSPSNVF